MSKKKAAVKKIARKSKKPTKQVAKRDALTLVNFKISKKDLQTVSANAKKYMDGNVSGWLRFAGMKFKPVAKAARV